MLACLVESLAWRVTPEDVGFEVSNAIMCRSHEMESM
jgi:hypothetical protein